MEGTNPIKVMEGVMAGLSSCPLRAGETWEDRVVAGVAATQSYRRHYTARGIVGHCSGVFAWSTQLPEETCPGVAAGQHPGPTAAGTGPLHLSSQDLQLWIQQTQGFALPLLAAFLLPGACCSSLKECWNPRGQSQTNREVMKFACVLYRVVGHTVKV